jgi:transcriptional regulator with XRE-family HTH domain
MPSSTALGQYLRARRELVRRGDVNVRTVGRRRVPGLRREELAMLAGISSDYYLRLEQGRDHHPSAQVIDALARALRLDEDATAHLHALAQPPAARTPREEPERAPTSIEHLIELWPNTPALVLGRHMDVLAANALASALSPVFTPGVNLVRAVFLDPELRNFVRDWEGIAYSAVARLRALVGPDVEDPRLAELVSELSVRSDEFRRLWARHDIQISAPRIHSFNHPLVGCLELKPERLSIIGTEGQVLIVHHAEPGSPSERALRLLAGVAAGEHRQDTFQSDARPSSTCGAPAGRG